MKKDNKIEEYATELYDWLSDCSDLDAIGCYTSFNEETKKWHCDFLDIEFPHIFRCKNCLKCVKEYKIFLNLLPESRVDKVTEYFEDDESIDEDDFIEEELYLDELGGFDNDIDEDDFDDFEEEDESEFKKQIL